MVLRHDWMHAKEMLVNQLYFIGFSPRVMHLKDADFLVSEADIPLHGSDGTPLMASAILAADLSLP